VFAHSRPHQDICEDDDTWLCPGWWDRGDKVPDYHNCFDHPDVGCASHNFGCFKRNGIEFAQCRPFEAGQNKDSCHSTEDWLCPGWENCGSAYEDCTSSRCCKDETKGAQNVQNVCYKRPYAHYAQCRPAREECEDTPEWLCPGSEGRSVNMGSWETCSAPHEKCLESGCCKDRKWGCYHNAHRDYAQCRPLAQEFDDVNTTWAGKCTDEPGWTCPGWQDCSELHGECIDSKCCRDHNAGCFRRPLLHHAQCLPQSRYNCSDPSAVEKDDNWLCPGTWEHCSGPSEDCWESRCCGNKDYACYELSRGTAQCMRKDECTREKPEALCREITEDSVELSEMVEFAEGHLPQIVIAIIICVAFGMCCCAVTMALVAQHIFGDQIREILEARKLRNTSTKLASSQAEPGLALSDGAPPYTKS